jgi:hypothetical protein
MDGVKAHFEVQVGKRTFPLVILYEREEFVAIVKKLLVAELKSTEPATFGKMEINVSWMTLYEKEDDFKSDKPKPISSVKIPNQKLFWAELTLPEGKVLNHLELFLNFETR